MTGTDMTLWWVAIALAVVVTAVVAVVLALIVRTAADIDAAVAEIWVRGQRVANNTIHIPTLYRIHEGVAGILGRAGHILQSSRAIASHAEGCPGCPTCLADHKR